MSFFKKIKNLFVKKNYFYGRDLSEWDWLGTTDVSFGSASGIVFFFLSKDGKSRSYHLEASSSYAKDTLKSLHKNVIISYPAWERGLMLLHSVIAEPSPFFKEYTFSHNNWVWNEDKRWWAVVENAPIVNGNVISVDFK